MQRNKVLFPLPEGPISVVTVPSSIVKLMFFSTRLPSKLFSMLESVIIDLTFYCRTR